VLTQFSILESNTKDTAVAHSYSKELSTKQKAQLKALGHHLDPVVQVGQHGLSPTVAQEIAVALDHHELIKIRLPGQNDSSAKEEIAEELQGLLPSHSHFVHRIGRTVLLYKEKEPAVAQITLKELGGRKAR
jgi:RNA-binding protein